MAVDAVAGAAFSLFTCVVGNFQHALEASLYGRRRLPMCYTRREEEYRSLKEVARQIRVEVEAPRKREQEAHRAEGERDKPLTEKVKEMVG